MLEIIENTGKEFGSEIGVFLATVIIAAIRRIFEKRTLRKKGILRDNEYLKDNFRHFEKYN